MGLSFGALAVVARSSSLSLGLGGGQTATTTTIPHIPDFSLVDRVLTLVELRSLLLAFVFVVVSFILAYLTNPSEASFRTYLTELAFRRHLSRLYDADADNENQHESNKNGSGLHIADAKRQPAQTKHPSAALHLPIIAPHQSHHGLKTSSKHSNGGVGDSSTPAQPLSASDGFHFANRATIGLRTPGHVFRSLGLCTIAAIPIVSDNETASPIVSTAMHSAKNSDPESPAIGKESGGDSDVTLAGKWFIGAFGKWWVGGTLQLRQQAVTPGGHGDSDKVLEKGDRFSAGVFSFRALDLDPITEGLVKNVTDSLSVFTGKARRATTSAANGTTANGNLNAAANSKNGRGRRGTGPSAVPNQRSASPPPLPKSATLPLHAPRVTGTPSDHSNIRGKTPATIPSAAQSTSPIPNNIVMPLSPTRRTSQPSLHNKSSSTSLKVPTAHHTHSVSSPHAVPSSAAMSSSPSSASYLSVASTTPALDASPIIVDILKQFHASQEDVAESRNQLALFLGSSELAHTQLQGSLDAARESKRREDIERSEAKGRLKTLEDAKRHAESVKRDAERRLRAALTTRDRASNKVEQLGKDIDAAQKKAQADAGRMDESSAWREEQSVQVKETMDLVKREIKVAEDVIAALVMRAKELEVQIQEEKAALARVEAEVAEKRQHFALAAAAAQASAAVRNLPPVNDDLNHPVSLIPHSEQSPQPAPSVAQFSPLTIPESSARHGPASAEPPSSPASNLPNNTVAGALSPTLSLYQRRHVAHESDVLSISPISREAAIVPRHTLTLGTDDPMFAPGHGHSNSTSSPNGKALSPIGSPASHMVTNGSSTMPSSDDSPIVAGPRPYNHSGRHFSPFADSGPISPFTSSLIPSSLLSSIDDSSTSLRTSPTSIGMDDFTLSYPIGRQPGRSHSLGGSAPATLGAPFVWQRPSPIESTIARQAWDGRMDNSNASGNSPVSSDVLYASPPNTRSSFGTTSGDYSFQTHPAALSSESLYRGDNEPAQQVSHRRWFNRGSHSAHTTPSAASVPGPTTNNIPKTRKESSLNPDAKVFRFTRGRSFQFPVRHGDDVGSNGNGVYGESSPIGEGRPRGSMGSTGSPNGTMGSTGSSMNPPAANNNSTTSFLSSLLAFTPSAEERAALQRALGHSVTGINPAWNQSGERLPSDHSPSPSLAHAYTTSQQHYPYHLQASSARSSQNDLANAGPIWADLYLPANPKQHEHLESGVLASSSTTSLPLNLPVTSSNHTQSKRTFSSLWNRKKAATGQSNGDAAVPEEDS